MATATNTHHLCAQTLTPPSHWQGWLALLAKAMATALGVSMILMVLVAATAARAMAAPNERTDAITPQTEPAQSAREELGPDRIIGEGSALIFQTSAGLIAAPMQSTQVKMRVSGHIVRTAVEQTFTNPSDQWINATYRFPLPDQSAVDTLSMTFNNKTVRGEIKTKEIAKRNYESARALGKRASLVAQRKPNDFTAQVANIGPKETIRIALEYQQTLSLGAEGWVLRFPTVVAPRYPGKKTGGMITAAYRPGRDRTAGAASPDDDYRSASTDTGINAVTARLKQRFFPPVLLSKDSRQNRIEIAVELDAGIPISAPESLTHRISVQATDEESSRYLVGLQVAELANRDFELRWEPQPGTKPHASVQFEQFGDHWYGLALVGAPDASQSTPIDQAREVIFVIDTSGSMHGDSLEQALDALRFALRRLNPKDRFNIVRFSDNHQALFGHSQRASTQNLAQATNFLDSFSANGGTRMQGALRFALSTPVPEGHISQVIFITDGAVRTEKQLFTQIESSLGNRRLFTVGIGSAPNGYFMRKAAAAGRGSFTMVSSNKQVQRRISNLFRKLAFPMLTDLRLTDEQGTPIATESPIRDLYIDEPIVHSFRTKVRPTKLFLQGKRGKENWQEAIGISESASSGIHKLWARDALRTMSADIRRASISGEQRKTLRNQATQLALKHELVSNYTALVAVDHSVGRPQGIQAKSQAVPRQLPQGWSAKHTLGTASQGSLAQGNAGIWMQLVIGAMLLLIAAMFGATCLTRAEQLIAGN